MATLPEGVGLDVSLQYVGKPTKTFLIDWSSKQISGMNEGFLAMRQAVEIILQSFRAGSRTHFQATAGFWLLIISNFRSRRWESLSADLM